MEERAKRRLEETGLLVAMNLKPWLDQFYQKLVYERRSSWHTVNAYFSDLKLFFAFLKNHMGCLCGLQEFENLRPADLRAFLAHRLQNNGSKRSNARLLSSLKGFVKYLRNQGHKVSSTFDVISAPRLDKRLPRPLSKLQSLDLMERPSNTWVELRNQSLFMLLYGGGLRISEALNLNGSDWKPSFLLIKGKGGKERYVPLLESVAKKVESYLKASPHPLTPQGPLFRGSRGDRLQPSVAQKAMRDLRLELGLPETATPHALRHSFATHLLEEGGELRHIQELLGHASLSSTQIYTALAQDKIFEAYQKAHPRSKKGSRG